MNNYAKHPDKFSQRHVGPSEDDVTSMLSELGYSSLSNFTKDVIPDSIMFNSKLNIDEGVSEQEALKILKSYASKNKNYKSYLGNGYYGTITPGVIKRNILENPGWYTQYTPYQAEIAQGRLEALLNFQTMISDLSGMDIANASLLDEATAAAEAMSMACNALRGKRSTFAVLDDINQQTVNVIKTRAEPLEIKVKNSTLEDFNFDEDTFAVLVQYPNRSGSVVDYSELVAKAHSNNSLVIVIADLLSLCLLKSPGEWGADIVIGNSQRFGVPMGFGGPHAAFIATKDKLKRNLPGRLIGVSKDSHGNDALRLALQTREQHIRRDRATSNICTAQVLLAIMSSMYAIYHGPNKLKEIATRVNYFTRVLSTSLKTNGFELYSDNFFDTIRVKCDSKKIIELGLEKNYNFWNYGDSVGISFDETVEIADINVILDIFDSPWVEPSMESIPSNLIRTDSFLEHPVFNSYHSETEMLRYIHRLEAKDLSLNFSMIPLGSCTMKLNSVTEMESVTWPEFANLHPYIPASQSEGYLNLFTDLENWLCDITGFSKLSLQPNAGSQGEYAGMLAIREFHHDRGDSNRNVCLIPTSAHGTNPASAVMVGMKVVGVSCDDEGNIDLEDFRIKIEQYSSSLSAAMITYPSTHGVFEEKIKQICDLVHKHGGQVYMDGANMNAMVGLCKPADIGADVCHLNLHKTFCIPHGGGGPGMGPIGVASHLADFLPSNPMDDYKANSKTGPVSATHWGSASILPISWAYIAMMGSEGLKYATEIAILNANYMASKLSSDYTILYKGNNGLIAHECILDTRNLITEAGLTIDDIAKRLMDYGFHAPTMSWPVANTLMIEPTESESKAEIDRFCDSMSSIKNEIDRIVKGEFSSEDNPLLGSPHTSLEVTSDDWNHEYSREIAAYPKSWLKTNKFWPSVGRVDNTHGDRNLICSCLDVDSYSEEDYE
ncbi:MAG: glycine dehydrogenase (aminomethyl-transferring) [Marine Group III euryarchaeote CG-Epi3]|jgi:glycine dehydrogenase|uniref:glycine dehydrogenase (aminomethyl-transferring) n=1 Tax=Marine Group III euryarchaeote CG-Epi3 TaxID=1888997 RepID=A0A1J5UGH1_9ARCH|nr:MAG: glycine dehydrogenase (aminomethyl-transferring) [Marine Group III euryarchaeote CG-Epi3]|tara:strand:+ start:4996 stop:7839 length:2844 start_codon:yes stop_codon:yes gene_type:complete